LGLYADLEKISKEILEDPLAYMSWNAKKLREKFNLTKDRSYVLVALLDMRVRQILESRESDESKA
jgi:hypothetical protein